jgi:hypothetical protein
MDFSNMVCVDRAFLRELAEWAKDAVELIDREYGYGDEFALLLVREDESAVLVQKLIDLSN